MTTIDLIGQLVFGWGSIATSVALFVYADDLGDGNVGADQ